MNRARTIVVIGCAFVAVAAFAQTPREDAHHLAAVLGQAADAAYCVAPLDIPSVDRGSAPGQQSTCTAEASCGSDPAVSCVGSSSCTAADRACPEERGHVTCDGVVTWCAMQCPSTCVATCTRFEDCLAQCGTYWFCASGGVCMPY